MQPTADQLATGIMHLGYEDPDTYPLSEIPFDVWKVLQERGHVERGPNGEPVLTAKGRMTFSALKSGKDVPEFEYVAETAFQVGDRVRTADGQKGEIVLLTKDGRYAYVRIIGDGPGAHVTLLSLDSLKKIGEVD